MKIRRIDDGTYLLKEACYCYLLVGSKKAMLIDSGVGIFNFNKAIRKIIGDKELIVAATHGHLDHFGGGRYFGKIYLPQGDRDVYDLHDSLAFRAWARARLPMPARPFFKRLVTPNPDNRAYFDDATVFDLGDRQIEALLTPGHTSGSVCFMDRKNRLFFGGDTLVGWGVLLHLDYSESPEVFGQSMRKIAGVIEGFDRILPGHHGIDIPKTSVEDYLALSGMAAKREGEYTATEFGFCRVVQYKDLRLFYKIKG
jgi:glyoxylase-like metal-dependent hydrolase (beta-lactamase superfamily II)